MRGLSYLVRNWCQKYFLNFCIIQISEKCFQISIFLSISTDLPHFGFNYHAIFLFSAIFFISCQFPVWPSHFFPFSRHFPSLTCGLPSFSRYCSSFRANFAGSIPRYHVGDQLNISCISPNSVPAAKLKWFINGEYADSGSEVWQTLDKH